MNAWKSRANWSGVMPIPVSRTENLSFTRPAASSSTPTVTMTSPRSVNFTALFTRLMRIWPRRKGSPTRFGGMPGWAEMRNSRFFSCAFWPTTVERLSRTSSNRKSAFSISSLPASIFEKSRMSLMMPKSAPAAPRTFVR